MRLRHYNFMSLVCHYMCSLDFSLKVYEERAEIRKKVEFFKYAQINGVKYEAVRKIWSSYN